MARTALVTGASSGIGRAVAAELVARGYRVLGTSRDPHTVADPVPGVEFLALDLDDDASVVACARAAGPVDVLVANAGESQSGPFEELPRDALERLFRTNVLGSVRLAQLVVPGMRERRTGRIVMVGSMLGSFPLAFRSSYVASKAALRGFAEAARDELRPFGVWMSVVEPGSINTGISQRRTKYIAADSPYRDAFESMIAHLDANESRGISAEKVAGVVADVVDADRPPLFRAVGSAAPAVFALARVLPRATMHRIVARRHGLTGKR